VEGVGKGEPAQPTFRDALRTQRVLDAILESAKDGRWVKVPRG
jgi:predicted dehydrogenase